MKTSIVVPCVPGHIRYLREALVPYVQKGFTPEDVVVSIAKQEEISEEQHQTLMDIVSTLDLKIKVILNSGLVRSGPNRQLATEQASGDLIVYQDADDIPHPRRIELISHFFNEFDIMHLNHSYYNLPNFVDISSDLSLVKKTADVYKTYFPNGVYKECLENSFDREHNSYAYGLYVGLGSTPVHGGALAVKRDVFKKVKWKDVHELELSSNFRMEDYEFNMDVVFNFQKSMIIDLPLYGYRC